MIPETPCSSEIDIRYETHAAGSLRRNPLSLPGRDSHYPSDVVRIDIYVLPPPAWSGGKLRIDLRISNRTLDVRDRWIAVRRRISAEIMTKTGPKATGTSKTP
jgi:hypothetical protein